MFYDLREAFADIFLTRNRCFTAYEVALHSDHSTIYIKDVLNSLSILYLLLEYVGFLFKNKYNVTLG